MVRRVFGLVVIVAFLGNSGCTVLMRGETDGAYAVQRAHADAIRAYGKQYRPDNLGVAASPFDTSRRIEVQVPPGTSVSTNGHGFGSFYHDLDVAAAARAARANQ